MNYTYRYSRALLARADDARPPMDVRWISDVRLHTIGEVDSTAWGHQTDAQQAASVTELKKFATDAQKKEHLRLRLLETPHF